MWIRLWRQGFDGMWWPVRGTKGIQIRKSEARAFKDAVTEAARCLAGEVKS
jgi:hypothetical protein